MVSIEGSGAFAQFSLLKNVIGTKFDNLAQLVCVPVDVICFVLRPNENICVFG